MSANVPSRVEQIDGLRGLSALMVAIHHGLLALSIGGVGELWQRSLMEPFDYQLKIAQLLLWFSNGSFFVMVFMVLSGWASALSYGRAGSVMSYYTRRFWRLVPVYVLTTLVLYLSMEIGLAPVVIREPSVWWSWWLQRPISIRELGEHLLFIKPGLGGATWTMSVFVTGAILYPVFHKLKSNMKIWTYMLIFADLALLAWVTQKDECLLFVGFVLGTLVTELAVKRKNWLEKLHSFHIIGITILVMSLRYLVLSRWVWLIEAVWAFVLVAATINSWLPFLANKLFILLGKISYSYYLWHFIVLYFTTRTVLDLAGGGVYGLVVNTLVSVILTIPVAWASYRLVEQSRWLGKRI